MVLSGLRYNNTDANNTKTSDVPQLVWAATGRRVAVVGVVGFRTTFRRATITRVHQDCA